MPASKKNDIKLNFNSLYIMLFDYENSYLNMVAVFLIIKNIISEILNYKIN